MVLKVPILHWKRVWKKFSSEMKQQWCDEKFNCALCDFLFLFPSVYYAQAQSKAFLISSDAITDACHLLIMDLDHR